MKVKRQKNRQLELTYPDGCKGEAPKTFGNRVETIMATNETENLADTTRLIEEICESRNVENALKRVVQNKGSAGVDGMKVKELPKYLKKQWPTIQEKLHEGTYTPKLIKRKEIPKATGGVRKLGIPCVVDRFIQQAVLQVLQKRWDPTFSEHSYGFRPGRSAQQAISQTQHHVSEGYEWVVDIDLEKYFDSVNHDMLMGRIAQRVEDKRLLKLIRAFLNAGIMEDGLESRPEGEGVPQGGPLSPLLSNLFLDDLDKELERRNHRFVRYADDSNVYVRTERAGKRVMEKITRFVEKKLKLKVNKTKSAVGRVNKRKFLGFTMLFGRKGQPLRHIAPESIKRFKDRIRRMTRRICGCSLEQVIEALNPFLRGWKGYYGKCDTYWTLRDLDGWIRRRLRSIAWEQWQTYRRRRDSLKRLGIKPFVASNAAWKGCESNSTWAMSKDPRVQKALSPKYFADLGLIRLEN